MEMAIRCGEVGKSGKGRGFAGEGGSWGVEWGSGVTWWWIFNIKGRKLGCWEGRFWVDEGRCDLDCGACLD